MRLVANSNNTSESIRPLEELVGYRSTDISLILFERSGACNVRRYAPRPSCRGE